LNKNYRHRSRYLYERICTFTACLKRVKNDGAIIENASEEKDLTQKGFVIILFATETRNSRKMMFLFSAS